jgi:hypothetical protein
MHPKNEFVKLTTFLAPTIEIPPVDYVMRPLETTLGPVMTIRTHNKLGFMGRKCAENRLREENRQKIANGNTCNVEIQKRRRPGAVNLP